MRTRMWSALLLTLAVVSACGVGSTSSDPSQSIEAGGSAVSMTPDAPSPDTASPPESVGVWNEVDFQNLPPELGKWDWKVVGCCLSGYNGDEGSPDFPGDGTLPDGEYYGSLRGWDPANPGVVTFAVYQLDDCALPEMNVAEECYDVTEFGDRFEIGTESIEIEVPLDETLLVMVLSNAESLTDPSILDGRSAVGTGSSLRSLLETLRTDFEIFIDPLIAPGASLDEIGASLAGSGSPFAMAPIADEYTMARWYRPGFPALSYSEGQKSDLRMIVPQYYDIDSDQMVAYTFDTFIIGGGSFEKRDGMIAFTYGWEFYGG